MELSTLYKLSDGCWALEVNFASNERDFQNWGIRFAERFGGSVHAYRASSRGAAFKVRVSGLNGYLVQDADRKVWLVAADRSANAAISEVDNEIQESLGTVGGYDRRGLPRDGSIMAMLGGARRRTGWLRNGKVAVKVESIWSTSVESGILEACRTVDESTQEG